MNTEINITTLIKGPLQLVLNITNRCNLHCLHCFNRSGENLRENELFDEEVLEIIKEISEIKPFNLCFSGGEPLLRKELLLKSAEILSSKGIRLSLVTNGCFINRETASDLKRAGISDIEVSIDGAKAETHERLRGVKGSFDKALEALESLREVNFPTYEASFVVSKFNVNELERTVELLESINVPALFIRPMLLLGTAGKHVNELLPDSNQCREIWRTITRVKLNGKNRISVEFYDPLNHLLIFPKKDYFSGIEIKAEGSLIPSPHFQIKIGNIRNHKLSEYWEAGIPFVWKLPRIKELLRQVNTQDDLRKIHNEMSNYNFDLIDERRDA